MGSQRESCKDGFDVRHGQRQEMEIAARIASFSERSSAQKQGCRGARCL